MTNKIPVAQGNIKNETAEEEEARLIATEKIRREFSDWVDSLGGPGRVSRVNEVDRTSLWRYCVGQQATPKLWLKFMFQSKLSDSLGEECRLLKIKVRKLEKQKQSLEEALILNK